MKKRLRLSDQPKILGVCGGIANYLNIDPTIVRIIFAFAVYYRFTGIGLYFAIWALIKFIL